MNLKDLSSLFLSMFTAAELRRLIQNSFDDSVMNALPGPEVSATEFAASAAEVLRSRGLIGVTLFDAIRAERPARKSEVDALESAWPRFDGRTKATAPTPSPFPASFRWLADNDLHRVYRAALDAGLAAHLDALTQGISERYVAQITTSGVASVRLMTILNHMNGVRSLRDGTVPLARWLDNAVLLTLGQQVEEVFISASEQVKGFREGSPH